VLHLGWLEAELAPDLDLARRVCKVAIGVIDRTERRIIGTGFITEIFIASEKNINSSYQVPGGERNPLVAGLFCRRQASSIPDEALWKIRISAPTSNQISYMPS
jgi:hypothetical protein